MRTKACTVDPAQIKTELRDRVGDDTLSGNGCHQLWKI